MYSTTTQRPPDAPKKKNSKLSFLLAELSDSDSDDSDSERQPAAAPSQFDPNKPWLKDFRLYLDTTEAVPDKMSAVSWWGVSTKSSHQSVSILTSLL